MNLNELFSLANSEKQSLYSLLDNFSLSADFDRVLNMDTFEE